MTMRQILRGFFETFCSIILTPALLVGHYMTGYGVFLYMLAVLYLLTFIGYVMLGWYSIHTMQRSEDLHDRLWSAVGSKMTVWKMLVSYLYWMATFAYTIYFSYYFLAMVVFIMAGIGHVVYVMGTSAHRLIAGRPAPAVVVHSDKDSY